MIDPDPTMEKYRLQCLKEAEEYYRATGMKLIVPGYVWDIIVRRGWQDDFIHLVFIA